MALHNLLLSGLARIFRQSWAMHWALEVRGQYYELTRVKTSRWPFWKAVMVVRTRETDARFRQVVHRVKVGCTVLSNAEIAQRGRQLCLQFSHQKASGWQWFFGTDYSQATSGR